MNLHFRNEIIHGKNTTLIKVYIKDEKLKNK